MESISARCCVPIREIRCGRAHASTGSTATSAGGCGASQPKTQILGVELTDESIRLADLPAARTRTVVVLGNESHGIPPEAMDMLDVAVEIPMIGTGDSLNVAVAGSLVLYKLAGFL